MQVIYSNRVERLYDHLKDRLFADQRPFIRRLITVASPAMKSWLTFHLAHDPQIQVATGFELVYLDQCLERVVQRTGPPPLLKHELALVIETELAILKKEAVWPELNHYLRKPGRMPAMAARLVQLFHLYTIYGQSMVRQWEENHADHWQMALWQRLAKKMSAWNMEQFAPREGDFQIHLFALSFIPPRHYRLLYHLAQKMPVHHYLLSPCATFWSDLLSPKQQSYREGIWAKKRIDPPDFEHHPLLASWGRVGREMAKQVEEGFSMTEEDYRIPPALQEHPAYSELYGGDLQPEGQERPLTMLEALQADLLLHRLPDGKIQLSSEDRSIQLHAASSKMREVQILTDQLVGILDKGGLEPRDILVMAPDITAYAPYIRTVLSQEGAPFDYQLIEVSLSAKQPLTGAFLQLIALAGGRWDTHSLLQFFEQPLFLEKHGFQQKELGQLRRWIEAAGIRWGMDVDQRDEMLKRSYCLGGMVERGRVGSWESGFSKLLRGLVDNDLALVEISDAELLGRWMRLIRSLHQQLKAINDGQERTLAVWADYLESLLYRFLKIDEGQEEVRQLIGHIRRLRQLDVGEALFSFTSLFFHLRELLEKQQICQRDHQLQAVRFCSLLPMRTLPAQVVAFLGMDEDSFPRSSADVSLNWLASWPKADWHPLQIDYDRYLFLEGILSARQTLLMSYVSGDGGQPSCLIEELFSYLDQAFLLGKLSPSTCCRYQHPFLPFDQQYFNGKLQSFSMRYYQAASLYYQADKQPLDPFIKNFVSCLCQIPIEDQTVTIRDLASSSRDPLGHYFRKTLDLYLETRPSLAAEESFQLSALDHSLIKRASLKEGVHKLERAAAFPWGSFGQLAEERLKDEVQELEARIHQFGAGEPFALTFGDGLGHYAPLEVPYRNGTTVHIYGTLNDVTTEGLLTYQNEDRTGVVKAWPQFLLFCSLVRREQLSIPLALLFAKSGEKKMAYFDNPLPLLQQWLDYYFLTLQGPSPLLPEWIPSFIKGEVQFINETCWQDPYFHNQSAKWALQRGFPNDELLHFWKPYAEKIFGKLYSAWFPARGKQS